MNAEVRMKEEVAGGRWQGLARRSTTKAAGRPQGPFKIKNPSPERLRKKCSRSAARDFGVLARLSEGACPQRPVTERKQSQNPEDPLLFSSQPNGYSFFENALNVRKIGKVMQAFLPLPGGSPVLSPIPPAKRPQILYFQPYRPCPNRSIYVIFTPKNTRFMAIFTSANL